MKNVSLIISIVALAAATVFGVLSLSKGGKNVETAVEEAAADAVASKGDIVYIDLDRILMEYDMANDLRSVVETKVQNIEAEVTRRGKKLEKDVTIVLGDIKKADLIIFAYPVYTFLAPYQLHRFIELLKENYSFSEPLRSVGIRAIGLKGYETALQQDIFGDFKKKETEEKIENSIYELRKKFGKTSISRASAEKE